LICTKSTGTAGSPRAAMEAAFIDCLRQGMQRGCVLPAAAPSRKARAALDKGGRGGLG